MILYSQVKLNAHQKKEESVKTWLRGKEPNGGYGVKMGRNETLRRP